MSNVLIDRKMQDSLEEIIGMLFAGNRILDRIKAQLSVKFVMPITSDYIHYKLSHKMPELADIIGDYIEDRNGCEGYPQTLSDFTEYEKSSDCFNKILSYFKDLESVVSSAMDMSIDLDDKVTEKFLNKFILKIYKYTAIALTLVDLSECYGDTPKDNMQLDSNIKKSMKG